MAAIHVDDERKLLEFLCEAMPPKLCSAEFRGLSLLIVDDGVGRAVVIDGFDGELPYGWDLRSRLRVAKEIVWIASLPETIAKAAGAACCGGRS